MLPQASDAVGRLLRAGLSRREFRVRTRRRGRGRHVEYGEARITLWCSKERAVELTPALLAEALDVCHYTDEGGRVRLVAVEPGRGAQGQLTLRQV